jgi:hypothetical protein
MPFAQQLAEWTDWDTAAYLLGQTLGVFTTAEFVNVKQVFWTNNMLGNGLHEALLALSRAGVLERREEPSEQFRWARRTPK